MKNHVTDRLPDYLMNELDRMQKAEVDSHLQECSMCREEYDALLKLWAKLGALPEEEPGPQTRVRFYAMLEAFQEGVAHRGKVQVGLKAAVNDLVAKFWPQEPVLQMGLAVALLVIGIFAGTRLGAPTQEQSELASLRSEVQMMGRLLTVSLLNQQSASERLRGVSWTTQIDHPDPQVSSALVRALKYDSNVNVRLAAIDALGKFIGDPAIQNEVVGALPRQESPMVQIALVDLLVEQGIKNSMPVLEKLAADPKVNKTVKKRIEEGVKQLSL